MASKTGGGHAASQRAKDSKMAGDLVKRGIVHGHRSYPWTQGINYPHLGEVGSAAHRRGRR